MNGVLMALSPVLAPIVVGWAGGTLVSRRAARRRADAEAERVEAEADRVEAEAERARAGVGQDVVQSASLVTSSALAALTALQTENERLRAELAEQRAASAGLLDAYAHQVAARAVAPTTSTSVIVVDEQGGTARSITSAPGA